MSGMKAPFALRWALAWAALTGDYYQMSVGTYAQEGAIYRFEVRSASLKRWKQWQERRRMKKTIEAEKAAQALADEEAAERDS